MRKALTTQATIIELLEKCKRNMTGVELRTIDNWGNILQVKFTKQDLQHVTSLLSEIDRIRSVIDTRFEGQHEVVRQRPVKKPKQESALETYLRKNK